MTSLRKSKTTTFDIVVLLISILLMAIVLYPLILVLSCSVSDPDLVAAGKIVLLPKKITLDGYKAVFQDRDIMVGYANSLFYTVFGTIINLIVTVPAGYALSRRNLPGRAIFSGMFLFIMYFSGGMIPTFLLVSKFGLNNTRAILLILGAFQAYNFIICRSFFVSFPNELVEAAEIDGCSPLRTFITIVLPLSKALLGVMVLYFAVAHWNSYFNAMVYIRDDALMPLQVFLRRILILSEQAVSYADGLDPEYIQSLLDKQALIKYSVIVVSSLPLLIAYPFVQKHFDKGVMIGSIKG